MIVASSRRRKRDAHDGFTLIECLVVVVIIGILVGLVMPAVQSSCAAARLSQCRQQPSSNRESLWANTTRHSAGSPGAATLSSNSSGVPFAAGGAFSPEAVLPPYLEQTALPISVNFTDVLVGHTVLGVGRGPHSIKQHGPGTVACGVPVPVG